MTMPQLFKGWTRLELAFCTITLLSHIADKKQNRRDIAQTYALTIKSSEKTDWSKVNAAIEARWSRYALDWIKKQAWSGKCFSKK